jgi:hypothetical protein
MKNYHLAEYEVYNVCFPPTPMIHFASGFKYRSAGGCGFDRSTGNGSLGLLGLSLTTFSSATTTALDTVSPVGTVTALSGTARSPEWPATITGP